MLLKEGTTVARYLQSLLAVKVKELASRAVASTKKTTQPYLYSETRAALAMKWVAQTVMCVAFPYAVLIALGTGVMLRICDPGAEKRKGVVERTAEWSSWLGKKVIPADKARGVLTRLLKSNLVKGPMKVVWGMSVQSSRVLPIDRLIRGQLAKALGDKANGLVNLNRIWSSIVARHSSAIYDFLTGDPNVSLKPLLMSAVDLLRPEQVGKILVILTKEYHDLNINLARRG